MIKSVSERKRVKGEMLIINHLPVRNSKKVLCSRFCTPSRPNRLYLQNFCFKQLLKFYIFYTFLHLNICLSWVPVGTGTRFCFTVSNLWQSSRPRIKIRNSAKNYFSSPNFFSLILSGELLLFYLIAVQEDNARLVQREAALVTQIEAMEKQMQKYVQVSNQTPYPPYPLPKILRTPLCHSFP